MAAGPMLSIDRFEAASPTAQFEPVQEVCPGKQVDLVIHFTGEAPWSFDFYAGALFMGTYVVTTTPYTIPVFPLVPTLYTIQNLQDATGSGPDASILVPVSPPPVAALSLAGPDTLCAGLRDTFRINFSGGTPPFVVRYSINKVLQPPLSTNSNPFVFLTPPLNTSGQIVVRLDSLKADGCVGVVTGSDTLFVKPAPTATLLSDTISLCNGQTDTLVIRFAGPGPYTLEYSANNDTLPALVTTDTIFKIPVTPAVGVNVYKLVSVFGGACYGTVSGTYRILVGNVPSATLTGDTTICPGESSHLLITFGGTAPFVLNYTANGVSQAADTSFFNPRVILVTPDSTTTYGLSSVSSNGCAGSVSGSATVAIQPALSATISGGGQICQNGTGTQLIFNFSGAGPYTFVYSVKVGGQPAVPQPPITTTLNPYSLPVNPPVGTVYQLVSVSNGTCTGTVTGTAVVAVFTPSTAFLAGDLIFCDSANTTLTVDFTGSGPFNLVYSVNGVNQPLVETFDDPYFIPVNITSTTTYKLISVESPGCVGMVNGMATVTIHYKPSYANVVFNCNFANSTYTVEFDVVGATLPLTLTTGSGTFTGTHFISNPIPILQGYNFVFHDVNNCGDITVSGPETCNCHTSAGTMNLSPQTACLGSAVSAVHAGDQGLDLADTLLFILHTNAALPIGQILAWNDTPSFTFQSGMQPNVQYYISAIAGIADPASGLVNLSDPCLSVSQGTPVTFFPLPDGDFGAAGTVCAGDTLHLPVHFTGSAPFSFSYSVDGVVQAPVQGISNTDYTLDFPLGGTVTVVLESVTDQHCTSGPVDTVQAAALPSPTLSNLLITCNLANSTYVLEFDASGQAPFSVSGLTGVFNGSHFTSQPIASTLPYSVQLTDANLCGQDTLSGVSNCACATAAGNLDTNSITACLPLPITVTHLGNSTLDNNDILTYVLHTGPGAGLGTVLDIQLQGVFNFNPGTMSTGAAYYISAVAGNDNGAGSIDLNDPCLSVSEPVRALWLAAPTAVIDTSFDICPGEKVFIPVTLSGQSPYSLTYSKDGQNTTVTVLQNTFSINATLVQSSVYQLVNVVDQNCPGMASGQATVTVHPAPDISNISLNCAPDNSYYIVEFDVPNADFSSLMLSGTITGTFNPLNGHFTSDPVPPQTGFSALVTDGWHCGQDSISGGVNCSCVTSAGAMTPAPQVLCNADTAFVLPALNPFLLPDDTLIYALVTTPAPQTWNILSLGGSLAFVFNPANMIPGQQYYVVALAGNKAAGGIDLNDPCLSFAVGPAITWRAVPLAVLGSDTEICQGGMANLSVQFTGSAPYSFVYQINGIDQPVQNTSSSSYILAVTPSASSTYTLGPVSANGCPGTALGSAQVTVHPVPDILNAVHNCDLSTGLYTLQFDIGNGAAPNPAYTISGLGGTLTDSTFTSVPIPSGQSYQVTVSDPNGCTATLSGSAICTCSTAPGTMNLSPISVCLPGTATAEFNNNALLNPGEKVQFVLHQNAAMLPTGILAVSNTPEFGLTGMMQTEQIYFISAMAGDSLANGNIDLNDPCLTFSAGVPVVFHTPPTAALSGDTTICVNNDADFKINFTGKAPFLFVYAVNTSPQAPIAAPQTTFSVSTNNVQQQQVFTLVSVQDAFCTGTVSGQYTVNIDLPPKGSVLGNTSICPGDTATLTLMLEGATAFDVTVNGGNQPIQLSSVANGATFQVLPVTTTTYSIGSFTVSGNVCPVQIGPGATVVVSPALFLSPQLSDYAGFEISCPGADDGSIALNPSGGTPPLSIVWDHGASGPVLNNLPAGQYSVVVQDQIGCTYADSFTLVESPGFEFSLKTQEPACFGTQTGTILIQNTTGGVGPYVVSLNGQTGQIAGNFPFTLSKLNAGTYHIALTDATGCEASIDTVLNEPPLLSVDLGPDTTIFFGDSIRITPLLNGLPVDSFLWTPSINLDAPGALAVWAKPPRSVEYTLWVRDSLGCSASDEVRISVRKDKRIYIPTAIQPNAGPNGTLTVFAGPEVRRLLTFRVYDRWGECVFEKLNTEPNEPDQGWSGTWRGKEAPPGVYLYVIEVEYSDGTTEVLAGDVTIVR